MGNRRRHETYQDESPQIVEAEFIKQGYWNSRLELWWNKQYGYFWTLQFGAAINGTYRAVEKT